jgi:hypothetical protein
MTVFRALDLVLMPLLMAAARGLWRWVMARKHQILKRPFP